MLQCTQEAIVRKPQPPHSSTALGFSRLTVAVIDDSPAFLEVVCALLESDADLDVVARGANGIEAIEITAKLRPDLVLMDIDMPHLDGLNAAAIISKCFPQSRILLMSAEESCELEADCRACGAVAFVCKSRIRKEFPHMLEAIAWT